MNIDHTSENSSRLKIKFHAKAAALSSSVIALSWVFESFRQIQNGPSFFYSLVLVVSIVATASLLWIQAFWIYLEEKSKGTLKRKVAVFEKMENWFQAKSKADQPTLAVRSVVARD